jgi:hypothetical protein
MKTEQEYSEQKKNMIAMIYLVESWHEPIEKKKGNMGKMSRVFIETQKKLTEKDKAAIEKKLEAEYQEFCSKEKKKDKK